MSLGAAGSAAACGAAGADAVLSAEQFDHGSSIVGIRLQPAFNRSDHSVSAGSLLHNLCSRHALFQTPPIKSLGPDFNP